MTQTKICFVNIFSIHNEEFHFIDKIICPFRAFTMPTEASAKKQPNKQLQKTASPRPTNKWPNRQAQNQTNPPKTPVNTRQMRAPLTTQSRFDVQNATMSA